MTAFTDFAEFYFFINGKLDEFIKERERYATIGDDLDLAFVELIPGIEVAYNDRHPKPPTPKQITPPPPPPEEPKPEGNFEHTFKQSTLQIREILMEIYLCSLSKFKIWHWIVCEFAKFTQSVCDQNDHGQISILSLMDKIKMNFMIVIRTSW